MSREANDSTPLGATDTAGLLLILTGILYYAGRAYQTAFFHRWHLPEGEIPWDNTTLLQVGLLNGGYYIVYLVVWIASQVEAPRFRASAAVRRTGNIIPAALAFYLVFLIGRGLVQTQIPFMSGPWLFLAFGALMIGALGVASALAMWRELRFMGQSRVGNVLAILLVSLLVVATAGYASSTAGDAAGLRAASGADPAIPSVTFEFIEDASTPRWVSANESWLLLAHAGGSYYVYKPSNDSGSLPPVFVVPDGVVRSAMIGSHADGPR